MKVVTVSFEELSALLDERLAVAMEKFKANATTTGDKLLTVEMVAEKLSCSQRYVYTLEKQRKFKRVSEPNKPVRFKLSEIQKYVDEGK